MSDEALATALEKLSAEQRERAEQRLIRLRTEPDMWAYTQEGFCALIMGALEMAGIERPFQEATRICFGGGPSVHPADLRKEVERAWTSRVVERALALLPDRKSEPCPAYANDPIVVANNEVRQTRGAL